MAEIHVSHVVAGHGDDASAAGKIIAAAGN